MKTIVIVDEQNKKNYTAGVSLSNDPLVLRAEIETILMRVGVETNFWNAYDMSNNFLTTSEY